MTLIESGADIATGASGNPQAVLQPRLAASRNSQSRFYVHGLLYSHRQFTTLQKYRDIGWHPCGVLRLAAGDRKGLLKLTECPGDFYSDRFLTSLSCKQAGELAGLPLSGPALWIPLGGWLKPAGLCQAYLESIPDSQLTLITSREVTALRRTESGWQVQGDKSQLAETSIVVIANSYLASRLTQTNHLPLVPVAGQLSRIASTPESERLRKVVVGDRYICPADCRTHSVGASYSRNAVTIDDRAGANRENLSGASAAFANLTLTGECEARVSVRCNSGDYFPIVGPAPDYPAFLRVFAPLARDASATCQGSAPNWAGLFVNVAHGSYGLASCPLSAELIASQADGELLPVTAPLADCLNPARFIIRELKKQQLTATTQTRS